VPAGDPGEHRGQQDHAYARWVSTGKCSPRSSVSLDPYRVARDAPTRYGVLRA